MEWNREDVLIAVRQDGRALQHAPECCRSDPEIVLAAMQQNGQPLQWAAESCRSDREIAQTAVQNSFLGLAIQWVADELVEDASFAADVKQHCYILKVTLLSGRHTYCFMRRDVLSFVTPLEDVLRDCCQKLGLEYRNTMRLLHGSEEVPADVKIHQWPGLRPTGEVTEYQLVI
mmetsp:Transcript_49190/g.90737  ORF Transcript_49190/g.90737 Transcript_49190/m.90737 type:complete len:174 (-) Transcript_49190:104-625(-)